MKCSNRNIFTLIQTDLISSKITHRKKNSNRAPSKADFEICFDVGRSVVGKFLREVGLGGENFLQEVLPSQGLLLSQGLLPST